MVSNFHDILSLVLPSGRGKGRASISFSALLERCESVGAVTIDGLETLPGGYSPSSEDD